MDARIWISVAVAMSLAVAACRSAVEDFYLPLTEEVECTSTGGGAGGSGGAGGGGGAAGGDDGGGRSAEASGGCSAR
jgi:hypothetical protein